MSLPLSPASCHSTAPATGHLHLLPNPPPHTSQFHLLPHASLSSLSPVPLLFALLMPNRTEDSHNCAFAILFRD